MSDKNGGAILLFVIIMGLYSSQTITRENNPEVLNNGTYTTIDVYPYLAVVFIPGIKICTGVIISNNIILTSAYCLAQREDLTQIRVRAGSSLRKEGGKALKVWKIQLHPLFKNKWGSEHNIGIVYLKSPIKWTKVLRPAVLPEECEKDYTDVRVVGWGPLVASNQYTAQLKYYNQTILERSECQTAYASKRSLTISTRALCATSDQPEQVCKGHGMPLIAETGKLIGIYGWRSNCSMSTLPEIYTNIAAYRSWLRGVTGV